MVGSKAYWHEAFLELIAMAVEYGVPEFFVTFTANESGWSDMTAACSGRHFSEAPVDATRHYFHRWNAFRDRYLKPGTNAPIGKIVRVWWRQEDQARGALHIHAAIWVAAGTAKPEAICATAPRLHPERREEPEDEPLPPAEAAWRDFVLNVQRHDCREKCHWKRGKRIGDDFCKYLYPHALYDGDERYRHAVCGIAHLASAECPGAADVTNVSDRYVYKCYLEEDRRLSPYIPVWLLAWGASMNIQYCTGPGAARTSNKCLPVPMLMLVRIAVLSCSRALRSAGFLKYIAKYVTKPEPYGQMHDTDDVRLRDNELTHSAQVPPSSPYHRRIIVVSSPYHRRIIAVSSPCNRRIIAASSTYNRHIYYHPPSCP